MRIKPRILFILHLPPPIHGAAVVGEQIRQSQLVNDTFSCRYINLSTSGKLSDIGHWSLEKIRSIVRLRRKVRKELHSFKPDLVYVTANSAGGGFLKDAPLVQMIKRMGYPVAVHFHNKGVAGSRIPAVLYRRFFKGIKVIQLSERLYPDIKAYVPAEDVRFCPNGTPDPGPMERDPHSVPHILFFSNFLEAKGIWTLLDACRILKERGASFVLDLAGGETASIDAACLAQEISARGLEEVTHLHVNPEAAKKEALFRGADLFVLPTFNDCFPLVVLEAMARSLPVVATPQGAIPDLVADGESGLLVPEKDAKALSDAIGKLLTESEMRTKMGLCGRSRYTQHYTVGQFETRFVEILQSFLR